MASSVSAAKGKTDSNYTSVIDQSGIYAGQGGFDVKVGGNTDLKGAVIDSEATPDKNKLDTGSLTYSDIENKAEYSSSSVGVNVGFGKDKDGKPLPLNQQGITPNIGIPASGDASSTTKSAISPGAIIVGGKEVSPEGLSRDPSGALNALGKIFDKKTVQERQELAQVFGEEAFKQIHEISERNGWKEGSPEKVALHTLIGGIMSSLGGSGFLSGAAGAGLNEALQNELSKITDPALHQWASAIIGAAAAKAVGADAQAGASTAASGTKNNDLLDVIKKKENEEAIREQLSKNPAAGQAFGEGLLEAVGADLAGTLDMAYLSTPAGQVQLAKSIIENPDLLTSIPEQIRNDLTNWYNDYANGDEVQNSKALGKAVGHALFAIVSAKGANAASSRLGISVGGSANASLESMYREVSLGRGSTGRVIPYSLNEQLAMKQVLSNPLEGAKELSSVTMTDSRWLAQEGWVKMSNNVNGTEIHFVFNKITGALDDFKFK